MATVKLRIRGIKELAHIYIRVLNGKGNDFEVKTGYVCRTKNFDNTAHNLSENDLNYKDVNTLRNQVIDALNEGEINKRWLQGVIKMHWAEKQNNYEPNKTELEMKELLLRMDFELFDRLKTQAKKNERSVTAEIKYILKNNVKK
jgi:hypothetical protein